MMPSKMMPSAVYLQSKWNFEIALFWGKCVFSHSKAYWDRFRTQLTACSEQLAYLGCLTATCIWHSTSWKAFGQSIAKFCDFAHLRFSSFLSLLLDSPQTFCIQSVQEEAEHAAGKFLAFVLIPELLGALPIIVSIRKFEFPAKSTLWQPDFDLL